MYVAILVTVDASVGKYNLENAYCSPTRGTRRALKVFSRLMRLSEIRECCIRACGNAALPSFLLGHPFTLVIQSRESRQHGISFVNIRWRSMFEVISWLLVASAPEFVDPSGMFQVTHDLLSRVEDLSIVEITERTNY